MSVERKTDLLGPLKVLLGDTAGRSGFEARRLWAFCHATRSRLTSGAYSLLEAIVTSQPSIGLLQRHFHNHGDDWSAVACACEEVINALSDWDDGVIRGPVLLPPPSDLTLVWVSLEDLAADLALYRDIAYEESRRAFASEITATAAESGLSRRSEPPKFVNNAEFDVISNSLLSNDTPRMWVHQDASNHKSMELKAAARSDAHGIDSVPFVNERLTVSWSQGGVRMELREQGTSLVVTIDNPALLNAAKRIMWLGKVFELASPIEGEQSKGVLNLTIRQASILLQNAEDPRPPQLDAVPCLLT